MKKEKKEKNNNKIFYLKIGAIIIFLALCILAVLEHSRVMIALSGFGLILMVLGTFWGEGQK